MNAPPVTYSITEVAAALCGDDMACPERWVTRRIREGTFRAIKVGRSWRMTDQQLNDAIAALEHTATTSPSPPGEHSAISFTRTTRRHMRPV